MKSYLKSIKIEEKHLQSSIPKENINTELPHFSRNDKVGFEKTRSLKTTQCIRSVLLQFCFKIVSNRVALCAF